MAKKHPGGGPGTYLKGGVRVTCDPPFAHRGVGSQEGLAAPFNHGRSGGGNDLPTHVYDATMGGPGKAPRASSRDSLGTILTQGDSRRRR